MNQSHPIKTILRDAARGNRPSRGQLDNALLDRPDLADGVNLNRLRREVLVAVDEIVTIGAPSPGSRQFTAARRRADEHIARLSTLMTDDELDAGPNPADGIDYDALARNH